MSTKAIGSAELRWRLSVHAALGAPMAYLFGWVIWAAAVDPFVLGADPAKSLTHYTGIWGFRALLLTLAVQPMARLLPRLRLVRYRRAAGLWAFAYLLVHALTYLVLWAGGLQALIDDLAERPYVLAGMVGLLLLVPLAVTSTRGWQRRLRGFWKTLHRLVFVAVAAGCLHFLWLTRADYTEPLLYLAVALALVGLRLKPALPRRQPAL